MTRVTLRNWAPGYSRCTFNGLEGLKMSRTNRLNEFRTLRAEWMRKARNASSDGLTVSRAECLRKARFFHSRAMWVKTAEWC